ncbi:MAG: hypothetical protein RIS79_4095, partial [Verrucomicrobiota bacterium]
FGPCCIGNGPRGLCHLAFVETEDHRDIEAAWPGARFRWSDAAAHEIAASIFQTGSGTPWKAFVRATPFQLRVWRALLRIPPGAVVSYGHLARAISSPQASRAVGSAVGANPLAYLIPCHRVIRETGIIGQYRWGHERKRALLAHEWSVP